MSLVKNLLLFFLLAFLFFECHTSKKLTTKHDYSNLTTDSLIHIIQERQNYTSLNFKGKIKVNYKGNFFDGRISLVSKSDSLSIISIKKLGLEAGRVLLCNDSVCIINRIDQYWKTLYPGDLVQFNGLDWDAYVLTDILLGGVYLTDFLNYSTELNAGKIILSAQTESLQSLSKFNKENVLPESSFYSAENKTIQFEYSDYITKGDRHIAKQILIKNIDAEIQINWEDINFNTVNKYNFIIPENYKHL